MAQPSVRVRIREDQFATITFDAPGRAPNLLTDAVWLELEKAVRLLSCQSGVRGVVLKSAKPGLFIAGADLKLLADAAPNDPRLRAVVDLGNRVLMQLEALPFPTAAIVDGAALGGGLEVALACDVILVGTDPRVELGLPEVKFGLIPGWGGTQRLSRVVGMPTAVDLVSTGRTLTAVQAAEVELAIGPVESGKLLDAALRVLTIEGWPAARRQKHDWIPVDTRLKYRPSSTDLTRAGREALNTIIEGAELPLPHAIRRETEGFFRLAGSAESKRLIGDFFDARKNDFEHMETLM